MSNKKDRWSALSMSERAEIFRRGVQAGITNRKTIIDIYNSFAPGGPIETDEYGYPADITPAIIVEEVPKTTKFFEDFANRYNIFHNTDATDTILKTIKDDIPVVKNKDHSMYNPLTDKIHLRTQDPVEYTHELTHKLNDSFPRRIKRTEEELQILKNAYPLSKKGVYGKLYEMLISDREYFTTNTELRRRISELYGNVLGEELNNVINSMSDNELARIAGLSGYSGIDDFYKYKNSIKSGKDLYEALIEGKENEKAYEDLSDKLKAYYQHMYENGSGRRTNAGKPNSELLNKVRKALIRVAQNTTDENRLDYVNPANITAFGGKLNKFAPGGPIEVDEYGYSADITPAIIEADYPRESEVWKRADASNADMIQRLKQSSSRVTIQDWEDSRKIATHKMMSAGKYAVGNVQNINGQLFDFTDPKHGFKNPDRAAIDSAIKRGDYVEFDTEGDARYFAEHYKKHYNGFSGEDDQDNNVYYYDDTPIEAPVVKAFNSKETYNRYYGEQFGKHIIKERDNLLGSYGPLFDPQRIVDNVPAREWGPQKVLGPKDFLVKPGTNILAAPIQYLSNNNLGKENIEFAKQIISDFDNLENKQKHIEENSDIYRSYLDAISYLNHVEALKKYLGLPYNTDTIKEGEYKPTRLQGSDTKVYKFSSAENPEYWSNVVNDMLYFNDKEHQYLDETLNTFTAYRDFDDKGDFISIYDEWDYNPSVQGGFKPLNKIIDVATGGKPFIIYDRIYLDDYYDIPEAFRGNPYISPAILTDTNAFMKMD